MVQRIIKDYTNISQKKIQLIRFKFKNFDQYISIGQHLLLFLISTLVRPKDLGNKYLTLSIARILLIWRNSKDKIVKFYVSSHEV